MPASRDESVEKGPKGQIVSKTLFDNRPLVKPGPVSLTDGLHCLMGINICNTQIVEAPDGLVVVDTGKSSADGHAILEWTSKLSEKPVIAVIYSHSHYTFGTAPILDRYPGARVVAHHKVHTNAMSTLSGVRRFMRRRASMESARYLPPEGADADYPGSKIQTPGSMAYVRPTDEISEDGTEIDLGGMTFVIHTEYPFDTNDTLFAWVPELKAILHNHFASNFPNVYPIQGGRYRDPQPWLAGLDLMRAYRPRYLLSTHGYPDSGEERCMDRLTAVRDALQFIHDQTVRGMNKHLTPDELVEFVRLPEPLSTHRDLLQTYGMASNHVRGVYSGLAGWYNGDPATIDPPDPDTEAHRVVEGFGGREVALKNVRDAVEAGDTRWAARLGGWLVRCCPDDKEVRGAQAVALRKLGQHTTAWTMRNYYLSQARALEGKVELNEPDRSIDTEIALQSEPGTYIRALGYRVDPSRCPDGEVTISIRFSDADYHGGITLRRGVAEPLSSAPEDATVAIECSRATWIESVDRLAPFSSIVDEDDVRVSPSREKARSVFVAFDG